MSNVTVDMVGRIPMSPSLAATLGRAHQHATAHADAEVTLEHLLLALIDDPEAGGVLTLSGVDIAVLRSDIDGHLSRGDDRRPPAHAGAIQLSSDVQRILEAAAAAAKGRRREIDGAIVVAAIVGDGNSTAAHLLRARGLTFEEAIKALQRFASRPPEPAPAPATPQPPPPPIATAPPPPSSRASGGTDDILASARQRVATRTGQPMSEPPGHTRPAPVADPRSLEPARGAAAVPPAPVPAEVAAAGPPPVAEPSEPLANGAEEFAPDWSPAVVPAPPLPERVTVPGARPPPQRRPEPAPPAAPPAQRAEPPPMPAPAAEPRTPAYPPREGWAPSGERSPAPPLAPRASASGPAEHAPLPPPIIRPPIPHLPPDPFDPAARSQSGRGPRNMAAPPMPPPMPAPATAPPPAARPAADAQRSGPRARAAADKARTGPSLERGQMAENIPRSMQVGVPKTAEVRIAKTDVKALAEGLQGAGTVWQHDVMISKAMSVRLRAPEGGFFIESASPETQWIESHLGGPFADDTASWRWTITPKTRGTRRLLLVVSVRTVGSDGLAAETALPDQVFEVKVRTNYGLAAQRWTGWAVAAVAGGLLGRFGDGLFDAIATGVKVLIK